MLFITFTSSVFCAFYHFSIFLYVSCTFLCFCVHYVFWCVLCVWAKLPEIKLDDDDDDDDDDDKGLKALSTLFDAVKLV